MNSDSLWDLSINEPTKMIDSAIIKREFGDLENNDQNENLDNNNDDDRGITTNNDNNNTDNITTSITITSSDNIDHEAGDDKEVMDAKNENDDHNEKRNEVATTTTTSTTTTTTTTAEVASSSSSSSKSNTNIDNDNVLNNANNSFDVKIELNVDNEEMDFLNNDSSNDYHSEYDDYSSSNGTTSAKKKDVVGEFNERKKFKQQQIDNHNIDSQHNNRHNHHRQSQNHNNNNSNNNQHYQQQHNQELQSHNYHLHYSENKQQQQHSAHSDEPEQMRKLFIGGLDYKTSEATLKQHFEKFGDVTDCVVMREPQSRRSRGFGFVIYANSSMVDKAQQARPHEVDGREVQSKRAISREDSGKPEAQATVKKVYLGGLSDDIEETELKDYFEIFGNIVNVNIVAHKDTGKRRGFAFVEYDDYDPVDKIVLKKFHTIKDKRIEAKKAIPKIEMDARKRGDPRGAMAGAMMALAGPPLEGLTGGPSVRQRSVRGPGSSAAAAAAAAAAANACLWDAGPYGAPDYPGSLDPYPPHYHYGAGNWMMHSGGGSQGSSSHGFRGAYGRSSYTNQASAADYSGFPSSQGGAGPMRLSYQHRWGPYGSGYGSTHRGRGYP